MTRRQQFRALVTVAALMFAGPTWTAFAAPSPNPSPSTGDWPRCPATALPLARSAASATPAPLPQATSAVGGEGLAKPGELLDTTPPPPAPSRATAWLVADADTGAVLAACNPHATLAPASTLKLLTALALLPKVPDAAQYTATDTAAAVDGTKVGLVPGLTYSGRDLWHGLLMNSGNDCAVALAELSGGESSAAAQMTAMARSLGAFDTQVVNTSGLDAPGQVSSAYDLALFGRAALTNKRLTQIAQTRSYAFPGRYVTASPSTGRPAATSGRRAPFQIQNHNRLLYNYPGATGLKNGWTSTAGGSFVGTATRNGHSYIVVLLRADTNTWRATAALLDWAFANGAQATPVGALITAQEAAALQETTPPSPSSSPLSAARTPAPSVEAPHVSSAATGLSEASMYWTVILGAVVGAVLIALGYYRSRRRSSDH